MASLNDRTDDEIISLAETAGRSDLMGVEMMRRLKDATIEQQKATNRLTRMIVVLTVALLLLAAIQGVFVAAAFTG